MRTGIKVLMSLLSIVLLSSITFAGDLVKQGRNRFVTRKINMEREMPESGKIRIQSVESISGKLYIVVSDKNQAQIEFRKLFKADEEEIAQEYVDVVQVVFKETISGLELLFQAPNPPPWRGSDNTVSIEGELSLPEGSMVAIDARYFDIYADGPFRSVSNTNSFGRLDVRHITEETILSTSHGHIFVEDLRGYISIETENADIRANGLVTQDKSALFSNKNGDLIISRCNGGFQINGSYGKVRAEEISAAGQKINIKCDYTPIYLALDRLDSATVFISNVNEDIDIIVPEGLSANVDLRVDTDSEIHVEGLPIKPRNINPQRIELQMGTGGSWISVEIMGIGDITFRGGR